MAKKKEVETQMETNSPEYDFDVPLPSRAFGAGSGRPAANQPLIDFMMHMPVGASKRIELEGRDIKVVKTAITTLQRQTAEVSEGTGKNGQPIKSYHAVRSYVVREDGEGFARIWRVK